MLAIPAIVILGFLHRPQGAAFADSVPIALFLIATGVVTVTPLLLFGASAKRVPLSMIGLLGYITPSMHSALGVWVYGEELSAQRLGWFVVVWLALGVYVYDSVTAHRSPTTPAELLG